ncbi:hypothetical protein EJV46_18090 [Roseococcus sp. SYP-B2431]|uniref:hypothetical protein n=1 Tax=Roseococcus sp. SYP-B2431 TaxID=2496640 RepID=UPI00103A6D28|nr:hypothetical protein [Roseococcus sp. SYP-B2431]TCH97219.1 hypothetical protein EJV46_18090 [Roseococcus sp. SYP-B2431]
MEPMVVEEFFGGPGPEDLLNAAAAIAQALRQFAAVEAQAAGGLRACLPGATDPGPISDIRRAKSVAQAAAEAASRAALLLEAADILAPGGTVAGLAAALATATKRAGLPPTILVPQLRAAALSLPTDDASARIAAAIRVQELAAALNA